MPIAAALLLPFSFSLFHCLGQRNDMEQNDQQEYIDFDRKDYDLFLHSLVCVFVLLKSKTIKPQKNELLFFHDLHVSMA